jgi:hypothetical protein
MRKHDNAPRPPDALDQALGDLMFDVLCRRAERQGRPPPTREQCVALGRLLAGRPADFDDRPGPDAVTEGE